MHYFFTLLRYHTSTCFGPICTLSSGQARPGPPTVDLEVIQVPFATLYTQPPDDGLQMGPKHALEVW
jgi:hypothetical protein